MRTSADNNRASQKKHYYANKEKYLAKNAKARQVKVDYLISLRAETPCMDCGIQYPYYVMEFDHRPEEVKLHNVTTLVSNSWNKLKAEIAKCDIVCANCHSIRTHVRRSGSPRAEAIDSKPIQ